MNTRCPPRASAACSSTWRRSGRVRHGVIPSPEPNRNRRDRKADLAVGRTRDPVDELQVDSDGVAEPEARFREDLTAVGLRVARSADDTQDDRGDLRLHDLR